ncbi:MAG: TetR/AcrR family transcriptional regulator [Flavobacteriaceae bacterium]|nr:MAG: TetR/AcrR family transcriptional regulator [Flavobacteriaceae bacterium]
MPWLICGLKLLAEGGNNRMNIDVLSERVGKAKTSFYHHFGSKKEFLYRLAQYWGKYYTKDYFDELAPIKEPKKRLKELLKKAYSGRDIDSVSFYFKELALKDPDLDTLVNYIESYRLKYVYQTLLDLGINKDQAIIKSKGFMYLFFGWSVLNPVQMLDKKSDFRDLERLIDYFIFEKI